MKPNYISILFVCLAVTISCLSLLTKPAFGAESQLLQEKDPELWELETLSKETFEKLDKDGNSLVARDTEWPGSDELFQLKDIDEDGSISEQERAQREFYPGAGGN